MTPELIRLLITVLVAAACVWSVAVFALMLVFGYPSKVPTPPLRRNSYRPATAAGIDAPPMPKKR